MTLQQAPRTAALGHLLDRIDAAVGESRGLAPARHSENHRHAIIACVDGLVTNQSDRIEALRKVLGVIEQRGLQSAAKAKAALEDHVALSDRLDDEIQHVQDLIADLDEKTREP